MVRQNGADGNAFTFDFASYCAGNPLPTTNTAPTVTNMVSQQLAVINTAYSLNIGSVFTDSQTPNTLTLLAEGLPAGLSLNGTLISGTPSSLGVSTITLRATDPGGLSSTVSFVLTITNTPITPPVTPPIGGPLTATVVTYNCSTGAIVFGSMGGNNTTVEYSALGVTGWTTGQAFTLEAGLRNDLKPITVKVRQNGVEGASFVFDLKAYCTSTPQPTVNTAPTVANTVGPQSALTGSAYSLNISNVFTDAQTPNALTLSAIGLPAGLSLNGTVISGTPSVLG